MTTPDGQEGCSSLEVTLLREHFTLSRTDSEACSDQNLQTPARPGCSVDSSHALMLSSRKPKSFLLLAGPMLHCLLSASGLACHTAWATEHLGILVTRASFPTSALLHRWKGGADRMRSLRSTISPLLLLFKQTLQR